MNPENWRQAKNLIAAALDLPEDARISFLSEHCRDAELRAAIAELLAHSGTSLGVVPLIAEGLFSEPDAPETSSTTPSTQPSLIQPGDALPSRFLKISRLGGGGFGDVYKIFDHASGSVLALKILRNPSASALYQFKQEFRSLAQFRHPNVARLYELLNAEGQWMFTMELVEGMPFNKRITPSSDDRPLRHALSQLVDGVSALHTAGLLHRDLKPSNVLVTADTRVVVVDFGLVRELQPFEPQDTLSMGGTPVYMAPEQISRGVLTEATDWYAVGVMLYEVLTGRAPFEGSVLDVLQRKQDIDVAAPKECAAGVADDLNEICMGLLQRDPSRRLTARGVQARLKSHDTAASIVVPSAASAPSIEFVGRERELRILQAAFMKARDGTPQVVHLQGASGIGKSALIRNFVAQLKHTVPNAIVLSGRCHSTESVPYQGVDEVIDALARHVRRMARADVEKILPRHFTLLARLFPVLEQLTPAGLMSTPPVADPTELRTRAFLVLRDMLGRLAERQPVVVIIDDLQWADHDALSALRELSAAPAAPSLLLLLAYRSEDAQEVSQSVSPANINGSLVRSGETETHVIALEGLDARDAERLVEAVAQPAALLDKHVVSAIVAESDGSPFFVCELVEGLAHASPVALRSGGTITVEQAVTRRLDALSVEERSYLELVSIAGRPTSLGVIDTAASVRSSLILRNDLVAKRLLRSVGSHDSESIELYHDRIREVVVAALSDERRRECHARLAAALARFGNVDPEQLAFHHERAGDIGEAIAHALAAARRANAALAFSKAAACYQQALSLGLHDQEERRGALTELGNALSNAGRGHEAAGAFLEGAELCSGGARLELRIRAASQYLRSGHLREGVRLFEAVLRSVGIRMPQNRQVLLIRILIERIRFRISKWRAPAFLKDDDTRGDSQIQVCAAAAVAFSMVDPLRGAFFSIRYLRLASRSGDRRHMCFALATEATQLCHSSRGAASERVAQLVSQASELADSIGDAHTRAFVLLMSGTVAYLQGRWKKASDRTDAALELLQTKCSGVAWELTTAHTIGFVSRCAGGEWAESGLRLPALIRDAMAKGDRYAHHSLRVLGCAYVLDLAADDPQKARQELRQDLDAWSYRYYDIQRANACLAGVDIALYEGNPADAVHVINSEWSAIARSKLLRIPTTFAFTYTARARATLALASSNLELDPHSRQILLNEAERDAELVRRKGPPWAHGLSLLILAGVASCRSDTDRMRSLLIEAESALAAAGLIPYLMAARWQLDATDHRSGPVVKDSSVREWTSRQHIRRPEKIFAGLAPGKWS